MKSTFTATVVALALSTSAQAADKVKFQLDWLPGGDKAPIYVCIKRGFCKEAGLDVTIEPGRGSSEALTKLATGSSDIGISGIGALMAARANEGIEVTAVMSVFNKGPHAFFTLEGNGIDGFSDIDGKSIATSPFTSSNVYLPLVLQDNGISEDNLKVTKSDPGALGPMLVTGQVDAIIAWLTDLARYKRQAAEGGKKLVIMPWSEAGLEMYATSLVASNRFLSERPDVARRFTAAFRKSIEYARDNPADAAQAVADAVPELDAGDAAESLADALALIFNEVTEAEGLGTLDQERLAKTWSRVAAAQGLDAEALDPETIVNRDFLQEN
ncbi:ABC transporter substrate-binding protein [Roseibium sp.]|uniref:ABC transporter substrate-binding protein n=1 Tax=Roseibium sp. TaxID=1936156 RepID=UPI003D13D222